jgi:hypothetical protein
LLHFNLRKDYKESPNKQRLWEEDNATIEITTINTIIEKALL